MITTERAKVLGHTLLGLSESMIDQAAESVFDLNQASLITYDEFQLLYFELFKTVQLSGGRAIDFEAFECMNENLMSDRQKGGELLHTESQFFDEHEADGSTYQLTSGHRTAATAHASMHHS